MLKFYKEPKWGDMPSGQATSTPWTGNNTTPLGRNLGSEEQVSASHFCFSKDEFFTAWTMEATSKTITYFDDNSLKWKTKSQLPYEQIVCDDGVYATSTSVNVSLASGTISLDNGYNGLNYQETLFLFVVIIFFVSFQTWSRISFKREDNTRT